MPTFIDAQLALITAPQHQAKALLTIDTPTPTRYCTGDDPIIHGAVRFNPHMMKLSPLTMARPLSAKWSILVHDPDRTLYDDLRANRSDWLDIDIIFQLLIKLRTDATWTECFALTMKRTTSEYNRVTGWFKLDCSGAAGIRPRAGLTVGNRTDFSYAPDASIPIKIGSSGFTFPSGPRTPNSPPPGGVNKPFVDPYDNMTAPGTQTAPDGATLPSTDLSSALVEAGMGVSNS